jgi:hypothetical protein
LGHEEGERLHEERRQETGEKTPDPSAREVEAPRPHEPKETVLVLGAIPPSGDADLGVRLGTGRLSWVRLRWPSVRGP